MSGAEGIVAVVLAAGLATRFGGDKLLHPWRGRPLAAHIADRLAEMGPMRIAICPPNSPRAELFAARGFAIVVNDAPERGLATSLALGAAEAIRLGALRILVCLADMPNVTAMHLEQLLAMDDDVVATLANGVRSPPATVRALLLPRLTELSGDSGARELLRGAATVEADAGLVRDFDVPGDFR